ncbi:PH domain-containing protein [Amycolatopsis sp. 195334CR]|uniref:PH domain-containing protein n=1 Tax=Amycolatopsis sp. 195334CR TaxID=2814588 RepID=UPI001A900B17|nr:PH domain-containing protein [Amycolatopsis sp. 195334CR]MBN6033686.1 PH domain-containing protein [Amycolatopsis sp. 195334CR]
MAFAGGGFLPEQLGFWAAAVVLVAAAAWFQRPGLFIGPRGVRLRSLSDTRVFAWADIARFDLRPVAEVSRWTAAKAIHLVLTTGQAIQTDVYYLDIQPNRNERKVRRLLAELRAAQPGA